jgi:DNA polymerase II small subunit/DNA polymerase delta subunit B
LYSSNIDLKEKIKMFNVGDKVEKVGGDYTFVGIVVSVFEKLSGAIRLVVEDDRGVLHVYSEKILRHVE